MATDRAQELLRQLSADLRLLWTQAGGPSLRVLSSRVGLGKSQLGKILAGQLRRPPDWRVVAGLVTSFLEYAGEHGHPDRLSPSTAIEDVWRPRYALVRQAFSEAARSDTGPAEPDPRLPPPPGPVVPRELPAASRHFVGRAAELAVLTALLDEATDRAGTAVVSAIGGTAGIGKSALAVHFARRVTDRFPDGQLHVNLRGFDPTGSPMTPAEAVRGFLESFGVPAARVPADLPAQVGLYRSLLAGRRVLIVLDNARDADQVRPLLPTTPGCLALVTSRNRLESLLVAEGAYPLALDLMSTGQAWEMLARRLGAQRLRVESAAVDEIVTRCAGLPLALAIVAARAAGQPGFPLATLAGELGDAGAALAALDAGEATTDVRTVFSWSYQRLSDPAARLFRLLGLHPGSDVGVAAAASLAGVPVPAAATMLTELARAHLVTEHVRGRYTCHDLLRAYAGQLAHDQETRTERDAAVARLLDHYAGTADRAASLLVAVREPVSVPAAGPGVTVERPADRPAALAWFTAEHHNLLAAVALAGSTGFDQHACQLAWGVVGYLDLCGRWPELADCQHTALSAAERLGDRAWQARIHRILGLSHGSMDRYGVSEAHFDLALRRYGEIGDTAGRARTHRGMCLTLERQGRFQAALEHAVRSRDLFLRTDDRAGQAYAWNSVGWYHALVGDFAEALVHCHRAITLLRETGDLFGEATTWDSLGYAHHHLGQHREAVTCYRRALDMLGEIGDRHFQAETLHHLGDTYRAMDDRAAARDAWQQALVIFTELRRPEAVEVRAKLNRLTGRGDTPAGAALPHLSSA
ncbi:MAG TPA: tetratricopeptide repeat protein [Catenuloplanes sp.]